MNSVVYRKLPHVIVLEGVAYDEVALSFTSTPWGPHKFVANLYGKGVGKSRNVPVNTNEEYHYGSIICSDGVVAEFSWDDQDSTEPVIERFVKMKGYRTSELESLLEGLL